MQNAMGEGAAGETRSRDGTEVAGVQHKCEKHSERWGAGGSCPEGLEDPIKVFGLILPAKAGILYRILS